MCWQCCHDTLQGASRQGHGVRTQVLCGWLSASMTLQQTFDYILLSHGVLAGPAITSMLSCLNHMVAA